jgi:hypothetical protein
VNRLTQTNPAELRSLKANLEQTADGRAALTSITQQVRWAHQYGLDQLVRQMGSFSDALSILEGPPANGRPSSSASASPDIAPPRSEQGSFGTALDILEDRSAPTMKETKPKIGAGEAGLEGYLSGASFNWRDEVYGASKASGLPDWLGGFRALIGAPRLAYEKATRPSPTLSDLVTGRPIRGPVEQAYDQAVAEIRERQKQAQEQHPFAYGAGNLGGAVATYFGAGNMLLALSYRG